MIVFFVFFQGNQSTAVAVSGSRGSLPVHRFPKSTGLFLDTDSNQGNQTAAGGWDIDLNIDIDAGSIPGRLINRRGCKWLPGKSTSSQVPEVNRLIKGE